MNKWEQQVNVDLDDLFDTVEKEEKQSTIEEDDPFSVFPEDDTEDIEDDDYGFSYEERMVLIAKDIDLEKASQYALETKKSPVEKDVLSTDFKTWWKKKGDKEFMKPSEIKEKIKIFKEEKEERTELPWREEYVYRDKCINCNRETKYICRGTASCPVCDGIFSEEGFEAVLQLDKVIERLKWLYEFMGKMEFVEYAPSDEDVEMIEKIRELILK